MDNEAFGIYESAAHMYAAAAQLSRLGMDEEAEHLVDHALIMVLDFVDPSEDPDPNAPIDGTIN